MSQSPQPISEWPDFLQGAEEVIDEQPDDKKEYLRQFIEKFESLSQLWNQKDPSYTNKKARNRGFDQLKEIYSKIKPNCTRDNVKRKINTLRCNYRKELRKIEYSKSGDCVYKPSSWVFYCLQFLSRMEQPVGFQQRNVPEESDSDKVSTNTLIFLALFLFWLDKNMGT